MSEHSHHIVCPHCAGVNRVPDDKDAAQAKCGRCRRALFVGGALPATTSTFDTHVARNQIPVVADFWAEWCGPCKAMAPVFERVAAAIEPRARFLKVDADAEQVLSARYNIRSIPTLMMFKNGHVVAQRAGASDAQSLRDWIEQHLR